MTNKTIGERIVALYQQVSRICLEDPRFVGSIEMKLLNQAKDPALEERVVHASLRLRGRFSISRNRHHTDHVTVWLEGNDMALYPDIVRQINQAIEEAGFASP